MAPSLLTLLTTSLAATAVVAAPFSSPNVPAESINYSSAITALSSTTIEPRDISYQTPSPGPRPRLQFSRIVNNRGRGGKWVSTSSRYERRGEKKHCDEKSIPAPSPPPSRGGRGGSVVVAAGNDRKKLSATVKNEKRPDDGFLETGSHRLKGTTEGHGKSKILESSRASAAPNAMVIGAEKAAKKSAPFIIKKRPGSGTLDHEEVTVTRIPGMTRGSTGSGRGGSTVGGAGRGGFIQPAPVPMPFEQVKQVPQRGDPRGGARGGRVCSSPRGCFGQGDGAL
ncbi:hypothetical protein BZA77DRAFT_383881 [Pyronema omphalodes]|nr:hypothetical protein BZA77DRAFT_383881 [Pyronema omphalodes]